MDYSVFLSLEVLMILTSLTIRVGSLVQDHCDTTLWDLGADTLGVHDVTGRCAEGHIYWRTPYGAIRISLEPKIQRKHNVNSTFEACFIASAYHTTVKFSLDNPGTGKLQPLVVLSPRSPQMSRELCFQSGSDPVVLYVESELVRESMTLGLVQVDYDIRYLPGPGERQDKDCRPCTDKEILEAVCSSDVVFSGTIDHVTHYPEFDETNLHLKVKKMIRQRNNLVRDSHTHRLVSSRPNYPRLKIHTDYGVQEWPPNEASALPSPTEISQSDSSSLIAPYRCGIKKGHGEFIFIGRVRFKRAFLNCAPRVEEFVKLWKRSKVKGYNICSLD